MHRIFAGLALFIGLHLVSQGALAASFDVEAETLSRLAVVTPEEEANVVGYVNSQYALMVITVVIELGIAGLLLFAGWSSAWRDRAERMLPFKFLQGFIYVPIYGVVTGVLALPLAWYEGYFIEHKYGLSTMSLGQWFQEHLMGMGLGLVMMTILVPLLYLLIRAFKERWWMFATGFSILMIVVLMFLQPLYIEPLFNEYKPMDEGPLKEEILSIARANGMQADDVKQVDASRQTNRVSANVAGLFGTTRIALNDNLLMQATPEGVEAVMAHEIGHHVLNHIWKMMAFMTILTFLVFAIVNALFGLFSRWFGERWGVRGIGDYAGLPLLFAVFVMTMFVATPAMKKMIYVQEAEADLFAINATQNPEAWAEVALLTAQYRKPHPSQFEETWLIDHPSPYARIRMAMVWKAEHLPPDAEAPGKEVQAAAEEQAEMDDGPEPEGAQE